MHLDPKPIHQIETESLKSCGSMSLASTMQTECDKGAHAGVLSSLRRFPTHNTSKPVHPLKNDTHIGPSQERGPLGWFHRKTQMIPIAGSPVLWYRQIGGNERWISAFRLNVPFDHAQKGYSEKPTQHAAGSSGDKPRIKYVTHPPSFLRPWHGVFSPRPPAKLLGPQQESTSPCQGFRVAPLDSTS